MRCVKFSPSSLHSTWVSSRPVTRKSTDELRHVVQSVFFPFSRGEKSIIVCDSSCVLLDEHKKTKLDAELGEIWVSLIPSLSTHWNVTCTAKPAFNQIYCCVIQLENVLKVSERVYRIFNSLFSLSFLSLFELFLLFTCFSCSDWDLNEMRAVNVRNIYSGEKRVTVSSSQVFQRRERTPRGMSVAEKIWLKASKSFLMRRWSFCGKNRKLLESSRTFERMEPKITQLVTSPESFCSFIDNLKLLKLQTQTKWTFKVDCPSKL